MPASACCLRAWTVRPFDTGTTNVDFNPPMRAALAGVGGIDPLHLAIGADVTVTTMDAAVTEDKVPPRCGG
jgi:hypothetical protein